MPEPECAYLLKLIDAYALVVGKAQDIVDEHFDGGHSTQREALAELFGLLRGPEWRDVEDMQIPLTGRPPRSALVRGQADDAGDDQLELALDRSVIPFRRRA
jgi:hypothetical protein